MWVLLVWWHQHAAQPSPELAAKSLAAGGARCGDGADAADIELGQTSQWDGDQLIVISAFRDSTRQAQQLGLA